MLSALRRTLIHVVANVTWTHKTREWILYNYEKWATSWQNPQNGMCAQRRLSSAWAPSQSNQSSLSAWRKLGSLATWTHWAHMPRLIGVFTGRTVILLVLSCCGSNNKWTASSEFGTYRLCEQRRFRRACTSAKSRQNLCCSLIHAVSQEEPSDRKPDPWPLWMARYAQLKFVMTECSKTQIRLTGLKWDVQEEPQA